MSSTPSVAHFPDTTPSKPTASQHPPEIFIIVRPPPSSNNPLNLQIQLLPNYGRGKREKDSMSRSSSTDLSRGSGPRVVNDMNNGSDSVSNPSSSKSHSNSFTAVALAGGLVSSSNVSPVPLSRTPSTSSRTSSIVDGGSSVYSSGTTGTSSGRNKVVPLYNLSWHNIRQTEVLDAGTDQKIAKFLKKGVEISGLLILESVDIAHSSHLFGHNPPVPKPSNPSKNHSVLIQKQSQLPTRDLDKIGGGNSTNLFSKLKTKIKNPVSSVSILPSATSKSDIIPFQNLAISHRFSTGPAPSDDRLNSPSTPTNPVLGGFSSLGSLLKNKSSGQAEKGANDITSIDGVFNLPSYKILKSRGYSWIVKKWLREDLQVRNEWLNENSFNIEKEICFEWRKKKQTSYPARRDRRGHQSKEISSGDNFKSLNGEQHRPQEKSERAKGVIHVDGEELTSDPNNLAVSSRSCSRPDVTIAGLVEETEDSDPEDSETPWICEIIIPSTRISQPIDDTSLGSDHGPRRILLATLTPAPHHPRLVCQLAIPFSLTPVILPAPNDTSMMGLSVEEMKDVVSVTCFWLISKEGIGGTGSGSGSRKKKTEK